MFLGSKRNERILGLIVSFALGCLFLAAAVTAESANSITFNNVLINKGEPGFEEAIVRHQRMLFLGGIVLMGVAGIYAYKLYRRSGCASSLKKRCHSKKRCHVPRSDN